MTPSAHCGMLIPPLVSFGNDSHLCPQSSMSVTPSSRTALSQIPIGGRARIVHIAGGRQLALRLLGLGLRVGTEVVVLHHRGGGLVVSHGETRVALGGGIVDKLSVEPLPASLPPS